MTQVGLAHTQRLEHQDIPLPEGGGASSKARQGGRWRKAGRAREAAHSQLLGSMQLAAWCQLLASPLRQPSAATSQQAPSCPPCWRRRPHGLTTHPAATALTSNGTLSPPMRHAADPKLNHHAMTPIHTFATHLPIISSLNSSGSLYAEGWGHASTTSFTISCRGRRARRGAGTSAVMHHLDMHQAQAQDSSRHQSTSSADTRHPSPPLPLATPSCLRVIDCHQLGDAAAPVLANLQCQQDRDQQALKPRFPQHSRKLVRPAGTTQAGVAVYARHDRHAACLLHSVSQQQPQHGARARARTHQDRLGVPSCGDDCRHIRAHLLHCVVAQALQLAQGGGRAGRQAGRRVSCEMPP